EEAISILRGLKERYENHHKVQIKDDALIAAVDLSHRYISSRHLPDKAIDLIDEAAARLRLEINSVPEAIDELNRRIRQLEIEKEAIKREGDKKKSGELATSLKELITERDAKNAVWQEERKIIEQIQRKKIEIEELKYKAMEAERGGDYGKVAEIRYGKIVAAQKEIEELNIKKGAGEFSMINEFVNPEAIAEVVAKWTGIPVNRMLESEKDKLLRMEDALHQRVIGQNEAITAVSNAIRRSRAGLQDPNRPIGSFLFMGTTGVGKTELARTLAQFLFNDQNMMTRIDMSEYQERHSVSRLVGAPPGYIGYEEGGQLTEAVRRKPYSVILLDEIEKAHPDVFNILLQVLDDGRLTDNKGRTADFRNTILIMTSNAGSEAIQANIKQMTDTNREEVIEKTRLEVMEVLKSNVRPEFINRIDEIVVFHPLTDSNIRDILMLQLDMVKAKIKEMGVTLEFTDSALTYLAKKGYDPAYGARPVKRILQRELVNELAKSLLEGSINKENPVVVDLSGGSLSFRN
ncbi:MAG: AAA family ATPase, partial [Bacteroidales bacterium]|nr:AAA family ATPase [Bacteroidales bacterium]